MTDQPRESDVAFIRALAQVLRENDLSEIEVRRDYGEDDSLDVRISRHMVMAAPPAPQPAPVAAALPAPGPASPAPAAHAQPAAEDPAQHPGAVTSPMVGTAYLAPEPGAASFVSIGDQVSEGQTLLIIEAMKTMNHIPAPRSGVVRRILIENGSPVEFGAPLMIVD